MTLVFPITEPEEVHVHKWYKWHCPHKSLTPELSSRHLYKTHIAAGVRQQVLAQGRAGRAMWTQRTGGGLWNCCLSRKNREASCERPSLSGWEETAGRKPHLQSSERLSCELEGNSWLLVSIDLAFWPSEPQSLLSSVWLVFTHVSKLLQRVVQVFGFSHFFSLVTKIFTTVCLMIVAANPFATVPWSKSCVFEKRFCCDFLLNTTSRAFFFP